MKYFIDDSRKVALFDVNPTIDKKTAWGFDANGEEYRLPISAIFEDDEEDFFEISIPIRFPKGFVPPMERDKKRCRMCPFYVHFDEYDDWECMKLNRDADYHCPISEYFKTEEIAADSLAQAEREAAFDNLKKMMAAHEAWKVNHPRSKYAPEDERIKEDLAKLKSCEDQLNEARMEELKKAPRISEEKRKELEKRLAAGEKIFNPKREKKQ